MRSRGDSTHQAVVDAWLARSIEHGSTVEVLRLFHAAFETIWNRAVTTLGSVTLTAIAERVLVNATERFAFLSAINTRPNGDARWREHLHDRLTSVPRAELIDGLRFGVVELLTVIGSLTAEILSPELHTALDEVVATKRDSSPTIAEPKQVTGKVER